MAATIRDIKRITGLSLATISKYLNGGNLLPENREKIEKAIGELHYEVNETARSLVTSRSRMIGIVVFDISNVFCARILQHLGTRLREAGYAAMICDSMNDPLQEAQNIRFLLGKKVDGLIVLPVAEDAAFLEPALRARVPVVLMDRSLSDPRFDCVKTDNRKASYEAVRMLADCGHRRIALIVSDTVSTGRERLDGCLRLMKERQIPVREEYLKPGTHSIGHGYRSMRELLALRERPSAVFLGNFEIILGAVMALNESMYQCPGDISLIGFDDLIISALSNPKLYLVVQPLEQMSMEAVRILLDQIGQDAAKHVELALEASIIKGESICPPADGQVFD